MTAVAAKVEKQGSESAEAPIQSTRETLESIVVAFILAFLFRAFVAEAFVIPTGSMAPTLMGAHKDLVCEHCGQPYQASASSEFDSTTGSITGYKTLASTCSNCRGVNDYDFRENPNHASFSGDRILVSKFDYVFTKPKRWDVLVFKFPLEARMNYIKRLIGLPGESLLITEGDVYTRRDAEQPWMIARKPPHKIRAMRQIVSDTGHPAPELIRQGWPSLWQPLLPGDANWQVENSESQWSAKLSAADNPTWLRYYHKVVSPEQWERVQQGGTLNPVDPYSSRLVTDFLAYNTSFILTDATSAFHLAPGGLAKFIPGFIRGQGTGVGWTPNDAIAADETVFEYAQDNGLHIRRERDANDGLHWVGDLAVELDVRVESETGTILLDLVEFGIHFQCSIDVDSGRATLQAIDSGQPVAMFDGQPSVSGPTPVRGAGSYRLEMANFDDQIVLWVNGKLIEFDHPTTFDSRLVRGVSQRRPQWSPKDPLDAAPIGIGGTNVSLQVQRAQVYRDIYYIAIRGRLFSDYPMGNFQSLASAVPDQSVRDNMRSTEEIVSTVYDHPEWWAQTSLFDERNVRQFELDDKQYFPMGDNSSSSSDARAWTGHNYVDERYLLGKALIVFWPHTWNTPVPMTPNFSRMGLIR